MNVVDISFKTDGKTIEVPPTKETKGKIKIATKQDLLENKNEYMLFGKAEPNKTREGIEH